jgi:hypothetical protein
MNDHLPPIFRDLLNRQFGAVFPVKRACPHCNGTGDVHRADGEWLGICTCPVGDAIRARLPPKDRLAE